MTAAVHTSSKGIQDVPWWKSIAAGQAERFWSHVDKRGSCWIWLLGRDKDGYGKFQINLPRENGKQKQINIRAHRFAFLIKNGFLSADLLMLHSCDVPACCRPDHLRAGTQLQNRSDAKVRNRIALGSAHGMAKLTESQAKEIIRLKADGMLLQAIADQFGIGKSTAQQVGTLYWRHLK